VEPERSTTYVAISGVGRAGKPSSTNTPLTASVTGAHPVEVTIVAPATTAMARARRVPGPVLLDGLQDPPSFP
jgi:hypothetical protein